MVTVLVLFVSKLTTPRYLSSGELLINGFYKFQEPKQFSDFSIITSDSQELTKQNFAGKWTLIYFGYTRCPAECPVAMSLMKGLYATLDGKNFDLTDKQVFLITIDPENDTADAVDSYAKAFNTSFTGARGDRGTLLSMATQFNVMVVQPPKAMGHDHMDHLENHSNNILLVNPMGEYVGFFRPPFDEENLLITYQSVVTPR